MTWRVAILALAILVSGGASPAIRDALGPEWGYRAVGFFVGTLIALGAFGAWRGTRQHAHDGRRHDQRDLRDQLRVVRPRARSALLLTTFVLQALATGAMLAGVDYVARVLLGQPGCRDHALRLLRRTGAGRDPAVAARRERRGARSPATSWVAAPRRRRPALALLRRAGSGSPSTLPASPSSASATREPDVPARDARRTSPRPTRRARRAPASGIYTGVWTAGETLGLALGPFVYAAVLALGGYVSSTGRRRRSPTRRRRPSRSGSRSCPPCSSRSPSWPCAATGSTRRCPMTHARRPADRRRSEVLATLRALQSATCRRTAAAPSPTSTTPGSPTPTPSAARPSRRSPSSNGLDPTAFPSLLRMENDLVGSRGGSSTPQTDSPGRHLRRHRVDPPRRPRRPCTADRTSRHPRMVLPTTAHAAFHKAAHWLGVEPVLVDVDPVTKRADPAAMAAAIDETHGARRRLRPVLRPRGHRPRAEIAALAAEPASAATSTPASAGGCCRTCDEPGPPGPSPSTGSRASASTCTSTPTPPRASRSCSTPRRRCARRTSSRRPVARLHDAQHHDAVDEVGRSARGGLGGHAPHRRSTATPASPEARARRRSTSRARWTASRAVGWSPPPDSTLLALVADGSCDVFTIADEMLVRGWFVQPQMSLPRPAADPPPHLQRGHGPVGARARRGPRASDRGRRAPSGPVPLDPAELVAAGRRDRPRHPRRGDVRRPARRRRTRGRGRRARAA